MVNNGNEGSSFPCDSFIKPGNTKQLQQSFDHSFQLQQSHHHNQKNNNNNNNNNNFAMETERVQFSDFYRNSSEELFLKSLMESSVGMPVPTMEMLGFKNLSQNFRADSEELFRSWLTNGENQGHNSSNIAHRTRQASRRLSTEIAGFSGQPPPAGASIQKRKSSDLLILQNNSIGGETSSADLYQNSTRTAVERGLQDSNLYLAKAWFHSSQPMTRSRSSELRKRYAAMQTAQTSLGMEPEIGFYGNGFSKLKDESSEPNNGFNGIPMCDMPNKLGNFMSPSNSSSSTFNAAVQTVGNNADQISSVVNMLKGTLERKKLINQQTEKEAFEDSSIMPNDGGAYNNYHGHGNCFQEIPGVFADEECLGGQVTDTGVVVAQVVQGSMTMDLDLEGFVNAANAIHQASALSREASQSESSAAAQVVSSGFDARNGPSNSGQTLSVCESSKKQVENGSNSKADFREKIIDNLKDDRKRRSLARYGSVTSAGSVDMADPTKKRRVERSRKMAEAKERNSAPAIPSDMQAVLKRCETLEKEVRSLKLNLSFMNRKDSEQTKQIEELQKQNEELTDEKERILEEIERIISDPGKM